MKKHCSIIRIATIAATIPAVLYADEKPNFVFFMAEDLSPHHFALYNDGKGAQTPMLDSLAQQGVVFTNAYSCAPVSSAARSTLITGCYAPRLGVSFHRRIQSVPMPKGLRMFPSYLREVGYYTSNAAKTDYNCDLDTTAWDDVRGSIKSWKNRSDQRKPFLFVRTNAMTHESCLHFKKEFYEKHKTAFDPKDVFLPPSAPDTKLTRYTHARLYDQIAKSDLELREIVEELKRTGEIANTFIFYFGDNGGCTPGTKGYVNEGGIKVPLVVYIPEEWRNKIDIPRGSRVDGFVNFMDLGPTLLHLAGVDVPKEMDGDPILGKRISAKRLNKRDVVYGYGDRYDELCAFSRTVRKGRYKYIRNFTPYHPKGLHNGYRYKMLAFEEWRDLFHRGELSQKQAAFFQSSGGEELYDLEKDPYETNNLVRNPAYQKERVELRKMLRRNMLRMNDLGLIPEALWIADGGHAPTTYGEQMHQHLKQVYDLIDLQCMPCDVDNEAIHDALDSHDPLLQYWAVTTLATWGAEAGKLSSQVSSLIKDPATHPIVKSRAVVYFAHAKDEAKVKEHVEILRETSDVLAMHAILNDMTYLHENREGFDYGLSFKDLNLGDQKIERGTSFNLKNRITFLK